MSMPNLVDIPISERVEFVATETLQIGDETTYDGRPIIVFGLKERHDGPPIVQAEYGYYDGDLIVSLPCSKLGGHIWDSPWWIDRDYQAQHCTRCPQMRTRRAKDDGTRSGRGLEDWSPTFD